MNIINCKILSGQVKDLCELVQFILLQYGDNKELFFAVEFKDNGEKEVTVHDGIVRDNPDIKIEP